MLNCSTSFFFVQGDSQMDNPIATFEINKYLVFGGEAFYPIGGAEDFQDSFKSLDEAEKFCIIKYGNHNRQWFQIVDRKSMKIIRSGTTEQDYILKEVYIDWDQ